MKITKEQLVAGYPSIQVRNFLRRFRSAVISASTVQNALKLGTAEAEVFLRRMVRLGLLEPSKHFSTKGRQAYEATTPGLALANASAAKPITRKTVDRLLREFMDRVQAINTSDEDEYAYKIASVVLFGSILSDKERLGDVDIAVELQPAASDDKEFDDVCHYRLIMARVDERHFSSDFERITWPATEIFRVLRAHSCSLALHDLSALTEMQGVSYRVLHGDPVRLGSMIPEGIPI
jgi:predicted nucleotidyltransferase